MAGVLAQGALYFTCQEGRSAVSHSSKQLKHTIHRHGAATTATGIRVCLTQNIKRHLQAPQKRAPVAASQILSVLSLLPLSTLAPSGEKEQEVTVLECPLSVHFSIPAQTSAVRAHIWRGSLGQHFIACTAELQ